MSVPIFQSYRWTGVAIASAIVGGWLLHLLWCLTRAELDSPLVVVHVLLQSFLSVGLFITAHDAMHRSLAPEHRSLNDAIGALALFLYGGFIWSDLRTSHFAHHTHPVTPEDPDYAPDRHERFVPWLWRFVSGYVASKNLAFMCLHVGAAWLISGSLWKVLVFFALPAWVSALQLFFFGTYLPHRTPAGGHSDEHSARSNAFPGWLSFLTCYHFGYHQEHHHYPRVPWWRLPQLRRALGQGLDLPPPARLPGTVTVGSRPRTSS